MSVKQISVFLENRPGTLNEMTKILADNKIDMRALSVSIPRITESGSRRNAFAMDPPMRPRPMMPIVMISSLFCAEAHPE